MTNANGDRVTEFKVEVTAKDRNGNVLGRGTCPAFSLDKAGLEKAIKRYDYKGVVQRLNRMIKIDARNDLASKKSVQAQMKAMEKENPDFAKEIAELRKRWGIQG